MALLCYLASWQFYFWSTRDRVVSCLVSTIVCAIKLFASLTCVVGVNVVLSFTQVNTLESYTARHVMMA